MRQQTFFIEFSFSEVDKAEANQKVHENLFDFFRQVLFVNFLIQIRRISSQAISF